MLFSRGHEGAACSCTGTQPTLLTESTSPQAADYDLDGTLDLLVLCNSNAVILTQTADGSWVHMPGAYEPQLPRANGGLSRTSQQGHTIPVPPYCE